MYIFRINENNNTKGYEMVILILFALIFALLTIFFSISIKLEIENLKIAFPKTRKKLTNNNSKVSLKVYILKKIKIVEINLKKIDLKNEKFKNQFKGTKFNLDTIDFLKKVNYIVEKLNLKCNIGFKDAAITAMTVGIIYMIVSNNLRDRIQNIQNIEYKVTPAYENRNILNVELDSIISIKLKNIIDIIRFMKKGRVKKNGRSSNRRSYAYSNE